MSSVPEVLRWISPIAPYSPISFLPERRNSYSTINPNQKVISWRAPTSVGNLRSYRKSLLGRRNTFLVGWGGELRTNHSSIRVELRSWARTAVIVAGSCPEFLILAAIQRDPVSACSGVKVASSQARLTLSTLAIRTKIMMKKSPARPLEAIKVYKVCTNRMRNYGTVTIRAAHSVVAVGGTLRYIWWTCIKYHGRIRTHLQVLEVWTTGSLVDWIDWLIGWFE